MFIEQFRNYQVFAKLQSHKNRSIIRVLTEGLERSSSGNWTLLIFSARQVASLQYKLYGIIFLSYKLYGIMKINLKILEYSDGLLNFMIFCRFRYCGLATHYCITNTVLGR